MNKPIAVLISDIHYNLNTLPLADAAMRQAISKANDFKVSLIVAGDLHDTKANMRAECINAMLETFKLCKKTAFILRGNHDQLNEKSLKHSLNFLKSDNVEIVEEVVHLKFIDTYCIPYQHDVVQFKKYLHEVPIGSKVIVHQGLIGANMGAYIEDKSAICKKDTNGHRIISGHYHRRQTIDLPYGHKWDYIGNSYTLNYGEANDPEKGFQILMDDGSLDFIPTNLRKHIVIELDDNGESLVPLHPYFDPRPDDLVRVKVYGRIEQLLSITKQDIRAYTGECDNFRLDLIPMDTEAKAPDDKQDLTQAELLDSLIDSLTNTSAETKTRIKDKWKRLI